jgi:hypothetical protein
MKKYAILFILCFTIAKTQAQKSDSTVFQFTPHTFTFEMKKPLSQNLVALRSDTTFYISGKIQTVTVYPLSNLNLSAEQTELKTAYQYDECGNLRNKTVFYQMGKMEMYGILGPRFLQIDTPYSVKNCDKNWRKPLLF